MNFEYYNKFYINNELATAIENLVNEYEEDEYVCKIENIIIPERTEQIYISHSNYNGHYERFINGIKIGYANETDNPYINITTPKEEHNYFIIMEKEKYNTFKQLPIRDKNDIDQFLKVFSVFSSKNFTCFDSTILSDSFPYLEPFFNHIDNWRSKTKRVTIDEDILHEGIKHTLKNTKTNKVLTKY